MNRRLVDEIFRKATSSKYFAKALLLSAGGNKEKAAKRLEEIRKSINNLADRYAKMSMFSAVPGTGLSEFPNFGTVISIAALNAMITSIAGFTTVEKAIDQANMVLYFADLISTSLHSQSGGSARYPVVGAPTYQDSAFAPQRLITNHVVTAAGAISSSGGEGTIGGSAGSASTTIVYAYNVPPDTVTNRPVYVVPRSTRIVLNISGTFQQATTPPTNIPFNFTVEILDNGNGSLLAPPSITLPNGGRLQLDLSASNAPTIVYGDRNSSASYYQVRIAYTIIPPTTTPATTILISSSNPINISVSHTFSLANPQEPMYPGLGNTSRVRLDLTRAVQVNTKVNLFAAELNLATIDSIAKSTGMDPMTFLTERISNVLTDLINRYIAETYLEGVRTRTRTVAIDVVTPIGPASSSAFASFDQYTPIVERIMGELESVNHVLASQSFVGLTPNAYLVSSRMAYWLARTALLDPANFVREDSRYINGLVGYYRGVPVIVNTILDRYFDNPLPGAASGTAASGSIGSGANATPVLSAGGFAIHNMPDNSLGPVLYATHLPITAAPTAVNFNNPIQQVIGLYHQSDAVPLAPELAVAFRFDGLPPVGFVQ